MRSILRALVALLLLSVSCRPKEIRQERFDYASHVGVVSAKAEKVCLEISNPSLAPDTELAIVSTTAPQVTSQAKIIGRAGSDCGAPIGDPNLQSYKVDFAEKERANLPAIAVSGSRGAFVKSGELVTADIDGGGENEFFRSCASAEGIHFTIWSGKPLEGRLRWHQYYYVGYDLDPDCTAKDTQPIKG